VGRCGLTARADRGRGDRATFYPLIHGSDQDSTRTAVMGAKVSDMEVIEPSAIAALAEARRRRLSGLVIDVVDDVDWRVVFRARVKG
jgi:hypothetical protein